MLLQIFILIFTVTAKQLNQWISQPYSPRVLVEHHQTKILDLHLLNLQNIYYSANIQLGSSNKNYSFIIDTGSSTFWVAGSGCSKCANQGLYNLYHCSAEEKCEKRDVQMTIQYGIGSVNGSFATSYAKIDNQQMKIDHLLVDTITDLPDFMASGLIGLGKRTENIPTLTELLYQVGVIPSPEFSLYLTPHSCQDESILSLGGSRSDLHIGELDFARSTNLEYWSVKFDMADLVRANKKETISTVAQYLLIDSGTTKITLPKLDIESLIHTMEKQFQISCNKLWVGSQPLQGIECSYNEDINQYPNLTFVLQSVKNSSFQLILTPSMYLDKCYFSIWSLGFRCLTNFQEMEGQEIILGVSFMQNYYTNFNLKDQTIGFAQLKEITKTTTKELIYKSLVSYTSVFSILITIISSLNVLFCLGKTYIYSKMELYASVLEKSSSRSDREQELSNIKSRTPVTQQSVPSFPDTDVKEFQEIPTMDEQEQ